MLAILLSGLAGSALADINVGVTLSATGPAASLGIPEKNTIDLLPKTIAGQKVNYIVLDDASDTTTAVKNSQETDQREQGRCDYWFDHDAEFTGDD
jgi:branched-chain amino acid transport system substrate-binding protein